MAVASQTGIISLGMLWWDTSYTGDTKAAAVAEVLRQGKFLSSAWDAQNKQLLIGIGDQMNSTARPPSLLMYSDYGAAPRALAVGDPKPIGGVPDPFGPKSPVAPQCSFAGEQGAAEVAAHAAAALALASGVLKRYTRGHDTDLQDFINQAISLFEYSERLAPTSNNAVKATDAVTDPRKTVVATQNAQSGSAGTKFGVRLVLRLWATAGLPARASVSRRLAQAARRGALASSGSARKPRAITDPRPYALQASQIYGIGKAEYVYAHQLWAACTIYQATQDLAFWNKTQDIYTRWIAADSDAAAAVRAARSRSAC
jgi:hypothetical protein